MPKVIIKGDAQWHELRQQNVGASEVAALFDLSPYTTLFTLWHSKAGNLPPDDFSNAAMTWGNRLEAAIAHGIAEDNKLKIKKNPSYWTHATVSGMGATPDYFILDGKRGPGVFQIKNVGWDSWSKKWKANDVIVPPIEYDLQVQHEMAVTGCTWGALGVLVGGRDPFYIERPRHEKAINAIEQKVQEFWQSIKDGNEPEVFNQMDYEAAIAMFRISTEGKHVDLSGHNSLAAFCDELIEKRGIYSAAEKDIETLKAKVLNIIRDAESVTCGPINIKAKTAKNNSRTLKVTKRENANGSK